MIQKSPAPNGAVEPTTSCTCAREAGRFVITVEGDLDFAAVESAPLKAALANYRSDEPIDIALDLEGVTFVDSLGLSWLMDVRSAAALADRRVRLRGSSPFVDKVLDMAGLRRYFPSEPQQA